MIWLVVALGGALGGAARVAVDHLLKPVDPLGFPRGILTCNLVGSFLLGATTTLAAGGHGAAPALVGTGFCGALTTWSTFSLDIVRLIEGGRSRRAAAYAGVSLVAGWAAAVAGLFLPLGG